MAWSPGRVDKRGLLRRLGCQREKMVSSIRKRVVAVVIIKRRDRMVIRRASPRRGMVIVNLRRAIVIITSLRIPRTTRTERSVRIGLQEQAVTAKKTVYMPQMSFKQVQQLIESTDEDCKDDHNGAVHITLLTESCITAKPTMTPVTRKATDTQACAH